MNRIILLDSGPLGLVTNPSGSGQAAKCEQWFQQMVDSGAAVMVPEIADYEIRRELLRARKTRGIKRLDSFIAKTDYLAITTNAMRQAAKYWAVARQQGRPTAADPALDADVILAAQATTLNRTNVVIATTNVTHLSHFTQAILWSDIDPEIPDSSKEDLVNDGEK